MESEIRDTDQLINFILSLPGSPPSGGIIRKGSRLGGIQDPRVEKIESSMEVMHLFNKYHIYPEDRRKLIADILNIKIIGI